MWAIGNPASHRWQSVSHRVAPAPLKHPLGDTGAGFLMQRIQTCKNLTGKANKKEHRGNCHYSGIYIHEQMLRLLLESQTSKTTKTGRRQNTQLTISSCKIDLLALCKLFGRITRVLSWPAFGFYITAVMILSGPISSLLSVWLRPHCSATTVRKKGVRKRDDGRQWSGWPSPRSQHGAVTSTTGSSCPSEMLLATPDLLAVGRFDLSQPQRLTLKCCICLTDRWQGAKQPGPPPICLDHGPGYELVFWGWVTLWGPEHNQ